MKGLVFTWLLTVVGVSSSIVSPFYGFIAYVALAILKPDSLWEHSISGGRFSLIVAMSMLLSWGFRGCGNWNLGRARGITLCFIGFWIWAILGALTADVPGPAWFFVEEVARILLPFLVGITSIRSVSDLRKLVWVIVLCEGYVCFEMNMWYFRGYNYLWHVGFAGMDNNSVAIGFVAVLGLCIFLFFSAENLLQRVVVVVCAAFIAHAIQFSFSRGAMLAAVLTSGICFFIMQKTTRHYVLFGGGLLLALMVAGPQVRERFLQTFEKKDGKYEASAQSRLDLWKDCYTLFKRDPIMGCGPNHWPLHAESFGWTPYKEAHSLWVQTATEMGIPGISLLAGFYVLCIWRCFWMLRSLTPEDDPLLADFARMTIASLCGFGVAAQFVSLETLEIPYYVNLVGAGTLMLHSRQRRERGRMMEPNSYAIAEPATTGFSNAGFSTAMNVDAADVFSNAEPRPSFDRSGFFNVETESWATGSTHAADWRDQIQPGDQMNQALDDSTSPSLTVALNEFETSDGQSDFSHPDSRVGILN
ncbi:MAG: O-antigen ligase family protein [Planctomycetaceae bacterium]|nr:O-antigen ligase family protein [Planctomycetaceae bacterium]